ncbi:unnamed protein product [Nyctereutes procyonoides]|uniref:(raccoon dog) hypothetical protein n=1 Tax=Nyctereutes procyonoides TaxID=34880 RepID=A0A811Z2P2_NYCPR|nr:unnamed protein product [Nyctereutes procyonoides]
MSGWLSITELKHRAKPQAWGWALDPPAPEICGTGAEAQTSTEETLQAAGVNLRRFPAGGSPQVTSHLASFLPSYSRPKSGSPRGPCAPGQALHCPSRPAQFWSSPPGPGACPPAQNDSPLFLAQVRRRDGQSGCLFVYLGFPRYLISPSRKRASGSCLASQAGLSLWPSESHQGSPAGTQANAPVFPGAVSSTLSSLPPGSWKA